MAKSTCPHCGTPITTHSASPCLSAWVAGTVMEWDVRSEDPGWWVYIDNHWSYSIGTPQLSEARWHPHEDIAAAMEVVETLNSAVFTKYSRVAWRCEAYPPHGIFNAVADTLPLAICRAAILAASKEEP